MTWLWMYMNWLEDISEKHEFATDYSIFLGSFNNPDAAQKMINSKNPKHVSTDDEFDEATKKLVEANKQQIDTDNKQTIPHRRKRKIVKD